jgi:hypothetical protein
MALWIAAPGTGAGAALVRLAWTSAMRTTRNSRPAMSCISLLSWIAAGRPDGPVPVPCKPQSIKF